MQTSNHPAGQGAPHRPMCRIENAPINRLTVTAITAAAEQGRQLGYSCGWTSGFAFGFATGAAAIATAFLLGINA